MHKRHLFNYFILTLIFVGVISCKDQGAQQALNTQTASETEIKQTLKKEAFKPSDEFKSYWYGGKAEITSYKLEQARYGEMRDGNAVLVFVTEDFLPQEQVKADAYNKENTSVLKLNATKNFNTGIYPYSIMQSTFYPVDNNTHAMKVTCSVQEWCGQEYTQLNNRSQFEIESHSYFASEGDEDFKLDKTILENELWTQLRMDPKSLPIGPIEIIPSFEYMTLKHLEFRAYDAIAELSNNSYKISYPELKRTILIYFNSSFPFDISGWEETYRDGFSANSKTLTTRASRLKSINSAYWLKNSNTDEVLRETLQLN